MTQTLIQRMHEAGFSEEACIGALQEEFLRRAKEAESKSQHLMQLYLTMAVALQRINFGLIHANIVEFMIPGELIVKTAIKCLEDKNRG